MNNRSLAIVGLLLTTTACSSTQNLPLMFGQQQSVGITLGTNPAEGGVEFVLGYKDKNIAIIPVTTIQGSGDSTLVRSEIDNASDAMSVIGQFEVSANSTSSDVSLGKFFATGLAAQKLADGFKAKLEK